MRGFVIFDWRRRNMPRGMRRLGWRSWELNIPIDETDSAERPRVFVREVIGSKEAAESELRRLQAELEDSKSNRKSHSTYRAFSLEDFRDWNWPKVQAFLTSSGGCFGVAGPRGIGKTWLLQRACEWANDHGGVGVYFPAPSAYDASSFIMAITDAFCVTLERNLQPTRTSRGLIRLLQNRLFYIPAIILIASAILYSMYALASHSFAISSRRLGHYYNLRFLSNLIHVLVVLLIAVVIYFIIKSLAFHRLQGRSVELRLKAAASEARQRLRYALNATESYEFGLSAGKGIIGSAKEAKQRSFTERPITLASLVYDFRDIAALTAKLLNRPIVVAVDELDKISSLDEMRSLLRDVKGIFDIPGTAFLVSISDEALRCVRAGSITGRDEFSSSFYAVAQVDPLDGTQASSLIEDRTGSGCPKCALGLTVLTCGNPRELIRLAGALSPHILQADDLPSAMRESLRGEARELLERVIGSSLLVDVKLVVAEFIQDNWLVTTQDSRLLTYTASSDKWISISYDDPENSILCEFWNRLLVRTWVAAALADVEEFGELATLSPAAMECVRLTSLSALWGRANGRATSLFS